MAQLKHVVPPFGEVNVYPAGSGRIRVVATILMQPHRDGCQTGLALDGSGSMQNLFEPAPGGGSLFSSFFGKKSATTNQISPIARKLCAYLARKLDADGGTTCIYWATGPGGSRVEVVGDLTGDQAENHEFGPPRDYGTGTQLLPAVRYFAERFREAPFGFYVFITDGELHDLESVKNYSRQLAKEIAAKRRSPMKFVLIGIGENINEAQMEELDDLDTGTEVDLWDHKIAAEMRFLEDIFAEVVDRNARVAPRGRIVDPQGRTLRDYSDTGVPAVLEFTAPEGTSYFTFEVPGNRVNQALQDHTRVPIAAAPSGEPPPSSRAATPASPPVAPPGVHLPEQAPESNDFIPNVGTDAESVNAAFLGAVAAELERDKQS